MCDITAAVMDATYSANITHKSRNVVSISQDKVVEINLSHYHK